MESAREKAAIVLAELVDRSEGSSPTLEECRRVVDAIIDAARSSESEHTRAVQEEQHRRSEGVAVPVEDWMTLGKSKPPTETS